MVRGNTRSISSVERDISRVGAANVIEEVIVKEELHVRKKKKEKREKCRPRK